MISFFKEEGTPRPNSNPASTGFGYNSWLLDGDDNQPPNPSANPDYTVDGQFRDVKSPFVEDPYSALENSLDSAIRNIGQAQNVDINLGRTSATTEQMKQALDDMINDTFDGADDLFQDWYSYTGRNDGSAFPLREIVVIENGSMTTIWPRATN